MKPVAIEVVPESLNGYSRYAPLAVLGYWLHQTNFLAPLWSALAWPVKTYQHSVSAKLETVLASILAGNRALYQINTTLRTDPVLAPAWGQAQFAEQSTVADLLNGAGAAQIAQLQQGSAALLCQHSRTLRQDWDWAEPLILDLDATALLASKRAEGSEPGWFSGQPHRCGRQLVRLSSAGYHETLASYLYPGRTNISTTLRPTLIDWAQRVALSAEQRRQIIIRTDAGLGTDANINWLLWAGYQVLTKGLSHSRAKAQARSLTEADWLRDPAQERWIAAAPKPPRFARRTRCYVLRWDTQAGPHYSTLITTLCDLSPLAALHLYDQRAAVESEIRCDKQGLLLPKRRKHRSTAQMMLILLTDVAHNLLSWLHAATLTRSVCVGFGTQRIVQDLLTIPGRLEFEGDQLHKVALAAAHPYAPVLRLALTELLSRTAIP